MNDVSTRRPTAAERVTQMNLYVEEQRKIREGDEKRRVFVAHIDDLEAKANLIEDEESREALLVCVDNMRAKAEAERVKAEEEQAAANQPQPAEAAA